VSAVASGKEHSSQELARKSAELYSTDDEDQHQIQLNMLTKQGIKEALEF
jgi:hypothetical protein